MSKRVIVLHLVLLCANPAFGQVLRLSTDTWVQIDAHVIDHADVIVDSQSGTVSVSTPIELPPGIDLGALDSDNSGNMIFTIKSSAILGGILVTPADIGQLSGATFSLVFDGSAHGVPIGAAIDAVTLDGNEYLMSFDTSVDFGNLFVHDEDLVRFNGADLNLELDLSASGLPGIQDLEAAHQLDDGTYLLSFAEHGEVGGVPFADEDILRYDPSGSSWTMVFDGSAMHVDLGGVSIDAISSVSDQLFKDGFESSIALLFR